MRTTCSAALLDAAAPQPRPRRRAPRPLRVGPRLPAAARRRRPAAPLGGQLRRASGRRRSPSRTGSPPRWSARSGRPPGAAARDAADFFARRACSSARGGARRRARPSQPAGAAVPAPGPRRRGLGRRARRPAGSASSTRSSAARLGPRAGGRLRDRPRRRCSPPPTRGEEIYEDVTTFPAVSRTSPSSPTASSAPSGSAARSSPPAASCCARPRSSTSTRASRSATGKSLALRLEFRAPDRTLTDEEVADRAGGDRRRPGGDRGGRSVADRRSSR